MRGLIRSLGVAWRGLTVAARLGVMAVLLAVWLASSVLTAALPGAFLLASTLAGMVVDAAQTVKGRQAVEVKNLDGKLTKKGAEADDLAHKNKVLSRKLDDVVVENRALKTRLAASELVDYRGAKRPIKEAVKDTSERIAKRTAAAAGRNVATMPGESVPVYGIAVVVAATTWEIADACAMMRDMHALDVAFNPENAISDRKVCGLRVPTAKELWEQIKKAPGDVWSRMKGFDFALPDVDFTGMFSTVITWGDGLVTWVIGE